MQTNDMLRVGTVRRAGAFVIVLAAVLSAILTGLILAATTPARAQGLAGEAMSRCHDLFASYRLKVGDSWIAGYEIGRNTFTPALGAPKSGSREYLEAANVRTEPTHQRLTLADEKNAFQYKGGVFFRAEAWRINVNGRWSPWKPSAVIFQCVANKVGGQWRVSGLDGYKTQGRFVHWFAPTRRP